MPPAAKGALPLWKPFQGVRLSWICGCVVFSEALGGIDNLKRLGPAHDEKTRFHKMGFPKGVTPFGRRRHIRLPDNFKMNLR